MLGSTRWGSPRMRAIMRRLPTRAGSRNWRQAALRSASRYRFFRASNCPREKGRPWPDARRFALSPQLQGTCRAADAVLTRARARGVTAMLNIATRERSEEHTSELQSLMRNSYAVFCLKKKKKQYD